VPLTLTTGECAALVAHLEKSWNDERLTDVLPRLKRAATPRKGNAAGKRFERRIANELREIVAHLPGEWKVARNQTDRQKGQVADGAGEFTVEGPRPFPWAFELKDGSKFAVEQLFARPIPTPLASTPKREGFWAQAARQAACVGRFPILIVREAGDHHREFAILRPEHRAMLVGPRLVLMYIEVDGERLDVLRWPDLVTADAERWLVPPPPPV
jgi:hypothetical protein